MEFRKKREWNFTEIFVDFYSIFENVRFLDFFLSKKKGKQIRINPHNLSRVLTNPRKIRWWF